MKTNSIFGGASFCLLLASTSVFSQGTAFTYQGQLNAGGAPANGSYDLRFTLYNTNSGGLPAEGPLTNSATTVSNGLFTVSIDFGPGVFTGSNYWLEIAAQTNSGAGFTTLAPRQPVTPSPYTVFASSAGSANAVAAGAAIPLAALPAAVVTNGATNVTVTGAFYGNGAGLSNVPGTVLTETIPGTSQTALTSGNYLLTNNGLDTLTLPAAPNVGDIITVTGVGSNGWQVEPVAGQTIVGAIAPAGVIWTEQSAPAANWISIASSSDGSHLAAAAGNGGIYTSINFGTNWAEQIGRPPSGLLSSVASSSDGSHLVAVLNGGGIYTSVNFGTNWTKQTVTPSSSTWQAAASSSDGSHLVAVSVAGIYTSINFGTNWTEQLGPPGYWGSVASSSDGSRLIAAVNNGGGLYISSDFGTNWTVQDTAPTSTNWASVASSSDGSHLAAVVYGGGIYTSSDFGANWTEQGGAPTAAYWASVASSSDGSHLFACEFYSDSDFDTGNLYTSTSFGVAWTEQNGAPSNSWSAVASSSDGNHLVAAINESGIYTSAPTVVPFAGAAGSTAQFQYVGNGLWQPLASAVLSQGLSAVLTNLQTGVRLTGSFAGNFSGDGSGLANININLPNVNGALPANSTWSITGSQANGFANPVALIENTDTNNLCGPALRVQSFGSSTPDGALSVSAQNTNGYIAKFGNAKDFVCVISNNGTIYANGMELTCDRNAKENFRPVDAQMVLDKVAALPISKWNYKTDSADRKHLGPMAQDFQAAFGLDGNDRKHISVVDEGGVALAAIQGLNEKLKEKDAEIQSLTKRLDELAQAVQALSQKK